MSINWEDIEEGTLIAAGIGLRKEDGSINPMCQIARKDGEGRWCDDDQDYASILMEGQRYWEEAYLREVEAANPADMEVINKEQHDEIWDARVVLMNEAGVPDVV